jgi:hypothetical protein
MPPQANTAQPSPRSKRVIISILNLFTLLSLVPIGFLTFLLAVFSTDAGSSAGVIPMLCVGGLVSIALLVGIYFSQRYLSYKWAILSVLPGAALVILFIVGNVLGSYLTHQAIGRGQTEYDANVPKSISMSKPVIAGALEAYKAENGTYPTHLIDVLNPPMFPLTTLCPFKTTEEMRTQGFADSTPWNFGVCKNISNEYLTETQRNLVFTLRGFAESRVSNSYEVTSDGASYKLCYGYTGKSPDCFNPGQ